MEDYSTGWINLGPVSREHAANIIRMMHSVSSAQGLGFLDDSQEALTDEELSPWLEDLEQENRTRLDYVRGRSVKKSIHIHDGHYMIREGAWYDHSNAELTELFARFGIILDDPTPEHSACSCDVCQPNSPLRDPNKALGMCGIVDPTKGTATLSEENQS